MFKNRFKQDKRYSPVGQDLSKDKTEEKRLREDFFRVEK
jgi:hypothetical protein